MVLLHIITSYQLLCAMTLSSNLKEESLLLISDALPNKLRRYKNKLGNHAQLEDFFDRVVSADLSYINDHSFEETDRYYSKLLGNLEQYSSIYVWGAHHSLGVLLTEKGIPFIYGEEGAGMLSRPEVLENICVSLGQPKIEYVKGLGLFDGTCNCSAVLCNMSAQKGSFHAENKTIINFDVVAELGKLPHEDRQGIISLFSSDQTIYIQPHTSLLLTQHFANLNLFSFEEQVLIYQMFADYFLPSRNLVIKPHPDDWMYYRQLFPEAQIIREKFPSEFIPFLFDNQPDCVATISSTAIYNLRGHYPEVLELDNRYEHDFPMTHRYYAAVRVAQALGNPVACMGANEVLVQRLMDTLEGEKPAMIEKGSMPHTLLVDDLTEQGEDGRRQVVGLLENLDSQSAVLFINSKNDYCWYDYDHKALWDGITPIVLEKKIRGPQGPDFNADTATEVVYLYSKSEEMRRMAQAIQIQKELPHTGIDVEQKAMTQEQERIRVLEGILAATEKRLLYYIEKEREEK